VEQNMNIRVPEAVAPGALADFVAISHTADYFTLDFVAMLGSRHDASTDRTDIDGQVVSRVKILPAQVFELMKALGEQLTQWETATGKKS
jgi:hypothetical protein